MKPTGFIKLHRSIVEWQWWEDINVRNLFIACLLQANHQDKNKGTLRIERGSFPTSYPHLAKISGLTNQQARTALTKLKVTGEITDKPLHKGRLITITNYNYYQDDNRQNNSEITGNQQAEQQADNSTIRMEEDKNIDIDINARARAGVSNDGDFDEWWKRYPHKVGKADAKKKFEIALRKSSLAELLHGIDRYIASKPPDRPYCNPATWLHQERWLDQPAPQTPTERNQNEQPSRSDRAKQAILRGLEG